MRKMIWASVLVTAAQLCLWCTTSMAQVPHLVYGEVRASDGGVPAIDQVAFEAFVQSRPAEVLTQEAAGQTGFLVESSPPRLIWMVQCSDFPTPWSIGDLLVVNMRNPSTGEQVSTEVLLTAEAYQDAGLLPLPLHLLVLEARWLDNGVEVRWETADEVDCIGFDLWRSVGRQESWSRVNDVLVQAKGGIGRVQEYRYLDSAVPVNATCRYRLQELSRDGTRTTLGVVTVATPALRPAGLHLSPGYPNPCRGGTKLRFALAKETITQVAILDLRGATLRVLAEGLMPKGDHMLSWDGRDEQGRELPAGIYFCRITAGREQRVQKIVHAK